MRLPAMGSSGLRLPPTADWLPQFCQAPTVFAAMLLAEMVVLVLALGPGEDRLSTLTLGTVLAQWIALSVVAVLCLVRPRLVSLGPALALLLVAAVLWLTTTAMAGIGYALAGAMGLSHGNVSANQFVWGLVAIAMLMAALGLRYGYVHVQWRRQVEAQARAEVQALTARIRPHFLFNSMNTIAGLVRVDADLAEQVIEDLSDLFRAALAAGEQAHTLEREFELCERYLAIEMLRVGERLQVEWAVDGAPMDLLLPPLLLQPLVENAVYHGVQPLPEGGVVRIAAQVDTDGLVIRIENPRPAQITVRKGGHGMAQDNVRQRLRYAFGDHARLEVIERPGYYAAVLHLPLTSYESRP